MNQPRRSAASTHRNMALALLVALALASLTTKRAEATALLDQSYLSGASAAATGDLDSRLAQTFTSGLDGILSTVTIGVTILENSSLGIYSTDNGSPVDFSSTALAQVRLSDISVNSTVAVDLASFNIPTRKGERLAIVLHGGRVQWRAGLRDFVDGYSGGEAFIPRAIASSWEPLTAFGGGDFHFQTFVINAPATALLMMTCIAGLFVRRSRQKRARVPEQD